MWVNWNKILDFSESYFHLYIIKVFIFIFIKYISKISFKKYLFFHLPIFLNLNIFKFLKFEKKIKPKYSCQIKNS